MVITCTFCHISDATCDFDVDGWNCGYRTTANVDGLTWDQIYDMEIIGCRTHPGSIKTNTKLVSINLRYVIFIQYISYIYIYYMYIYITCFLLYVCRETAKNKSDSLVHLSAGYEDWKSWKPQCGHVFTATTSVILSEFLSGTSVWKEEFLIRKFYRCKFHIVRPMGDVIVLVWKRFNLRKMYTNFVKVSGRLTFVAIYNVKYFMCF